MNCQQRLGILGGCLLGSLACCTQMAYLWTQVSFVTPCGFLLVVLLAAVSGLVVMHTRHSSWRM